MLPFTSGKEVNMLVKRTVFAMQEAPAENGYETVMKEQAKHLGEGLFREDAKLKVLEKNGQLNPKTKENWLENMIADYVKDFGEEITFNTDVLQLEKDIPIEKLCLSPFKETSETYMKLELGKIVQSRIKEYDNFIEKVLRKYTDTIHFKIIKICGKDYSFFTF